MLTPFYEKLHITDTVSVIIVSIALMLICGFAATRVTKRMRLPNVTAYIVAGILIGPYCLNLVPGNVIGGMDFIADIALAFIAFSTGEFFKFDTLKKSGGKVMVITVFEAILASVLVFIITFFVLGLELNFSIVLAALASATAPASTVMTIRQTHAKGDFVDTLLQVVALDDVVGLVAYSIAISVALASATGAFHAGAIFKPLAINALVLLLGGGFGFFLKLLLHKRSTDNRLIVSIALLFAFCGICAMLDVSPLLGCMSMGMVYINLTDDKRLFQQLNYFSPPILLLFFVRSGLNFDLDALVDNSESIGTTPLVVVGILYFLVRIVGKYAGAFLGCLVTKKDKKVRNFLGLALIPQAGVAIGLAGHRRADAGRRGGQRPGNHHSGVQRALRTDRPRLRQAVAVPVRLLLQQAGGSGTHSGYGALGQPPKSEVELLIERIQAIQQELPKHNNPYYEDEQAFTEAAAEHSAQMEAFFGTPGKANTAMPGRKRK